MNSLKKTGSQVATAMTPNGTAVEGVCVTRRNPPVDCPGCEHGFVPVGRRVWRNICHHGARGLYHDRGTRRRFIDDLNVQAFGILSRLFCKYCDKQITPTDRVS